MANVIRYIVFTSVVGLLQLIVVLCVGENLAFRLLIIFSVVYWVVFSYRFIYYRAFIKKYLSLNLKYLGDKYKLPFILRSFIGRIMLSNKKESDFTDVRAITYYKEQKILEVIGGCFLALFILSAIILASRWKG